MLFIPDDDAIEAKCVAIYNKVAEAEGFTVAGWRDVPIDVSAVGEIARKTMPRFKQVFITSKEGLSGDELERELFIVRKLVEKEKVRRPGGPFCLCVGWGEVGGIMVRFEVS